MTQTKLAARQYQLEAIDAVRREWHAGNRKTAVVMPTGTGKTITFATMADRWLSNGHRDDGPVLVLAHRDELVRQAQHKIQEVAPALSVGILKAEKRELAGDVIVASVQTLARSNRRMELPRVSMCIIDECHHATAETYRAVLDHIGPVPVAGFTATLARGDGAALGDVWDSVAYRMDLLDAIREGHLVDARGIRVTLPGLDLDDVAYRNGDYAEGDLGRAMLAAGAPDEIAKVYVEHAADRKGLVFTPSVETAQCVALALEDAGVSAAAIWGAMPMDERRQVLADAYHGKIQVLVNCMVLTEGFDWPEASAVVVARPTASAPLYTQIVGRVLRTFPGKADALVIDVVGVGSRHRLACMADLAGVEKVEDGDSLVEAVEKDETEEAGRREIALKLLRGKGSAAEFDLFGKSAWSWKRTNAGNWFLADGERYYAIAPGSKPGFFHVISMTTKGRELGGEFHHRDVEMTLAMAYGEQLATQRVGAKALASRKAGWKTGEPSAAQLSMCRQLKINTDGLNKGQVSDLIDVRFASDRMDRLNVMQVQW